MLYGGTEFACRHQVSLFDKDDNFGDKAQDLSGLLRRCKAIKTTLPLTGAVWYDCRVGAAIGHYDGPEGTALGVFDLSQRSIKQGLFCNICHKTPPVFRQKSKSNHDRRTFRRKLSPVQPHGGTRGCLVR